MTKSRKGEKPRKWTPEEDRVLLNQIEAFPHNLTKCFAIVSEVVNRTPGACAARWYTKLSKNPNIEPLFATMSKQHCSKNRKNGMGVPSTPSIWRKILNLIKGL